MRCTPMGTSEEGTRIITRSAEDANVHQSEDVSTMYIKCCLIAYLHSFNHLYTYSLLVFYTCSYCSKRDMQCPAHNE